jgi:hypothetical protein
MSCVPHLAVPLDLVRLDIGHLSRSIFYITYMIFNRNGNLVVRNMFSPSCRAFTNHLLPHHLLVRSGRLSPRKISCLFQRSKSHKISILFADYHNRGALIIRNGK